MVKKKDNTTPNSSLQIRSLWVKDFFKLKDFSIVFNSNISVLIGENGSGKSSVIECLADIFGHLFKYFVLHDTTADFVDNYLIEYTIDGKNISIESHFSDSESNTFAPIIKIDEEQIEATKNRTQRELFAQYLPSKIVMSYSGVSKQLYHLNKHFEDRYIKKIINTKNNYSLLPILLPNENPFIYIKDQYVEFIALALMVNNSEPAQSILNTIGIDVNGCKVSIIIKKPSWAKPQKSSTYPWGIQGKVATDFIDGLNSYGNLLENEEKSAKLQYDFYGVFDILPFFEFFELTSSQVLSFLDTLLCDDLLDSIQISWKKDNEPFSLDRLSEGEKQLLLSEGLCVVLDQRNALLLMDEPDVSLHPKWQREFIPNIRNVWSENAMAVITTHSPNLVSSLKTNELHLIRDGRIIEKSLNYIGKTAEDILIDYFGLTSTRSMEAELLINQVWNEIKKESIDYENFNQLLEKLTRLIGKDDKELCAINLSMIRRKKGNA